MFLNAVMIATFLIAAPDSDSRDGTQLLIKALVQVDQLEHEYLDARLPPRYVNTWLADINDIDNWISVPAAEYNARFEAMQPVILALIDATSADPAQFELSMIPNQHRETAFAQTRRNAVRLLLADAERMVLSGRVTAATDRIIGAIRVIEVDFRSPDEGGFAEPAWDRTLGHAMSGTLISMARETVCLVLPVLPDAERDRIEASLDQLISQRQVIQSKLPAMYMFSLFKSATTYEGPYPNAWYPHLYLAWWRVSDALLEDSPASLTYIDIHLRDLARDNPLTRRLFWPGIRRMSESFSTGDPSTAVQRLAHAATAADSGAFGLTAESIASTLSGLTYIWFQSSDDIAAMQHLLTRPPSIAVEAKPSVATFAGLYSAMDAELDGAKQGSLGSTRNVAELAVILLDYAKLWGLDSLSTVERDAIRTDLRNLRPDDPLRFEANLKREAERMYIEMSDLIVTHWTNRERFLQFAPNWFESRGVSDSARGIEQVSSEICDNEDFQQSLQDFARGWLVNELKPEWPIRGELYKLRFPASKALNPPDVAPVHARDVQIQGPMAVYLARDWFDDLVAVQKGTRALWELRDLLEAD